MRALVADDEQLARHRVVRLLSALPDVQVVCECETGAAVLEAVAAHPIDVCFLDIHMPGLTGSEVADLLGPEGPCIVFLTAHSDHAVDAFAAGAVDYILKPVGAARLATAVQRVRARLQPTPGGAPDGRLALPTRNGVVLLDLNSISHARIDGASVVVHAEGKPHFTDWRLADLERRLGTRFHRVHRQALVNLDHISRLEDLDSGGYLAHLRSGEVVTVSRATARTLRRVWGLPR